MSKTFDRLDEEFQRLVQSALRMAGQGSYDTKTIDLFRGLDISGRRQLVPSITDQDGLVFFTKPHLNLSTRNLVADRTLVQLTRNNNMSFNSAIRCYLDPRSHNATVGSYINRTLFSNTNPFTSEEANKLAIDSLLVDRKNPFIPLLSNTLTSFSGWPDLVGDVYQSAAGMFRQSTTFLDGTPRLYENRTFTGNWQNIQGNPVMMLMFFWLYYGLAQSEGLVVPWPDQVITRRINYDTRVFKLVLDSQRRHVIGIASAIMFPESISIGSWFNHNRDEILKSDSKDITFQFRTRFGVRYQDPLIIEQFNWFVGLYNPDMQRIDPNDNTYILKGVYDGTYERLTDVQYDPENFNYVYPYIHPATGELQWYAPIATLRQPGVAPSESGNFDEGDSEIFDFS